MKGLMQVSSPITAHPPTCTHPPSPLSGLLNKHPLVSANRCLCLLISSPTNAIYVSSCCLLYMLSCPSIYRLYTNDGCIVGMPGSGMSSLSYPRPFAGLRHSQSFPSQLPSMHTTRATTPLQFSPSSAGPSVGPIRFSRPPPAIPAVPSRYVPPSDRVQPVYRRNVEDESSSSRDTMQMEADDHGALNLSSRSSRNSRSTDSCTKSPPQTSKENW